jgi:hypothetical protein
MMMRLPFSASNHKLRLLRPTTNHQRLFRSQLRRHPPTRKQPLRHLALNKSLSHTRRIARD